MGTNAPGHPTQVLAVDAVGVEGAADGPDDRHAAVAEPAVHVLRVVAHACDASRDRPSRIRAVGGISHERRGRDCHATAVIVDAVRTPGGKRNGKLSNWHAVDLASEALQGHRERNDLDPALVDDVIMGCVMQVGEQALNVGRNAVLAAGWPESVPATTIDRQCGSSQQALHFAAQGVMSGAYDIVVAAGVEVMTRVPMGSSVVQATSASPSARA